MMKLISDHSAGMVATINDDGTPSVSPKATFVILDDSCLAFGNIRSPGTLANLSKRPAVEVCFIDVVIRKAVRVTGTASIVRKADADSRILAAFDKSWSAYVLHMSAFVPSTPRPSPVPYKNFIRLYAAVTNCATKAAGGFVAWRGLSRRIQR